MTLTEENLVIKHYQQLKSDRAKFVSKWKDVQNYAAITNNIEHEFSDTETGAEQKDILINDPTAFNCTNQAGDYLIGILLSENFLSLEPSKFIKENGEEEELNTFFKRVTDTTLEQMFSPDAALLTIAKPYGYDQFSFGNSGIGTFKSKEFENEQSEYCLSYKPYGVWNSCIDEGANKVNVVFTRYNWRLNRIIDEFCYTDGEIDNKKIKELPEEIQKAVDENDYTTKFKLVYGILPNKHFKMGLRGIKGTKFKGHWFLEGSSKVFQVDYYKEMPIAFCRAINVNNQVYGEGAGSLTISSIKMLNFIMGRAIDNLDKNTDRPIGVLSGALIKGNVFDRSANSVTQFNPQAVEGTGAPPVFPIGDIGDISGLVNFLVPKGEKDITDMYKLDQLLDFNSKGSRTATEANYRMSIRGKCTSGLISQQKTELLVPLTHRSVSIIQDCGLYGYILEDLPERTEEEIAFKEKVVQEKNYIPEVIVKAIKAGKRWYKLKFNGELEKLANAEKYESIAQFLQLIEFIARVSPETLLALKPYRLLTFFKEISNLSNEDFMHTEIEFNNIIEQTKKAQQDQAQMQNALAQAQIAKSAASANKDQAQANSQVGNNFESEQENGQ